MNYKLSNDIDGLKSIDLIQTVILGKGAQANVYKAVAQGKNFAAKIFHSASSLDINKINAMISNPPRNILGEISGFTYPKYSWPRALINEGNKTVGYLMPLIDLNESFTLDFYYDKILNKKLNSPEEKALSYRLEIAANLSQLISELHEDGHHFIDFKPQNVRVFKGSHAVTLVDCDGFSIKSLNGKIYPADLLSADYISPEAFRNKNKASELGEEQDRYALAVIIFQLLNGGIHPFQGIVANGVTASTNDEKAALGLYPHSAVVNPKIMPRKQSVHNCFPEKIIKHFNLAFIGQPFYRPTPKEWAILLHGILNNNELSRCSLYPYDLSHIRFNNKECPECYLNNLKNTKNGPLNSDGGFNKYTQNNKTNLQKYSTSNRVYIPPTPQKKSISFWGGLAYLAVFLILFTVILLGKESNKGSQPKTIAQQIIQNNPQIENIPSADQKSNIDSKLIGSYSSFGKDANLTIAINNGSLEGKYTIVYDKCTGEVEGAVEKVNESNWKLLKNSDDGNVCNIFISITKGRGDHRLKVSENNCAYYHGAGCGFDQILIKNDNLRKNISPSFDCSVASNETEITICHVEKLTLLDIRNFQLFKKASLISLDEAKEILERSVPLKEQCSWDVNCIENNYLDSISQYTEIVTRKN